MLGVLVGFVVGGVVGALVAAAAGWITLYPDNTLEVTPVGLFTSVAFQALGGVLVLWYLSARQGTGSFSRDFGLELRAEHWWGIPAGAGLQFAAVIITLPLINLLFPEGPPEQSVVGVAGSASDTVDLVLVVVALVVLAPVTEELIFRGILLSRLVRSMSPVWAIVVSAALFALIHYLGDQNAVAALPGLFLIAVALGYAAIKTGSLSLPIFLHAGVNLTATVLLLFEDDIVNWLEDAGVEAAVAALQFLF